MTNSTHDIYKKAVIENFKFLKAAENLRDAFLRAIPIGQRGFLLPVCSAHNSDIELLQKLTDWRNANVDVYPTQFVATVDSTRSWLKDRLLVVEDRMLFLVIDNVGKVLGHIGFNDCLNSAQAFEIDNIVRGDAAAEKGIFSEAIITLIEWARKTINVNEFFIRVIDKNQRESLFLKRMNLYRIDSYHW
jgi:perosamine synthetase